MTTKRHPFHSICPYFAMFPEQFVEQQLLTYTAPGDVVLDPFCGRGTTVLEGLLHDRDTAGSDINPVAVCLSAAKANAPTLIEVLTRIQRLKEEFGPERPAEEVPTPFFAHCYETRTLAEILFLRQMLSWRTDHVDCFIAAITLGLLHGDSHRSGYCLSNRMPRTISTKPDYSIRWWTERRLQPPRRNAFETLRMAALFRYRMAPAARKGVVRNTDVRDLARAFPELTERVVLVVTSPPYLDTTDYSEDQWLRLWFLGGEPRPVLRVNRDDRHTRVDEYWRFLQAAWCGLAPLMANEATIVVRMGGTKLSKEELFEGLSSGLASAMCGHQVDPLHRGITSSIRPRETSAFRPASSKMSVEHDFVFLCGRNQATS